MITFSFRVVECTKASSNAEAVNLCPKGVAELLHEVEVSSIQPPLVEEGSSANANVFELSDRLVHVQPFFLWGSNLNDNVGGRLPSTALRCRKDAGSPFQTNCELQEETLCSLHGWAEGDPREARTTGTLCLPADEKAYITSPPTHSHLDPARKGLKTSTTRRIRVAPFLCMQNPGLRSCGLTIEIENSVLVTAMTALRWVLGQVMRHASIIDTPEGPRLKKYTSFETPLSLPSVYDIAEGILMFVQCYRKLGRLACSPFCHESDCRASQKRRDTEKDLLFNIEKVDKYTSLFYEWCWKMAQLIDSECQLKWKNQTCHSCNPSMETDYRDEGRVDYTPYSCIATDLLRFPEKTNCQSKEKTGALMVELVRVRWSSSLVRALFNIYTHVCYPGFTDATAMAVSLYAVMEPSKHGNLLPSSSPDRKKNEGEADVQKEKSSLWISSSSTSSVRCSFLLRVEVAPAHFSKGMWSFLSFSPTLPTPLFFRPQNVLRRAANMLEVLLEIYVSGAERARENGSDCFSQAVAEKRSGHFDVAVSLLLEAKEHYEKCISCAQDGLKNVYNMSFFQNTGRMNESPSFLSHVLSGDDDNEDWKTSLMERWSEFQQVTEASRERAVMRERLDIATEALLEAFCSFRGTIIKEEGETGFSMRQGRHAMISLQNELENFWRRLDAPFMGCGDSSGDDGQWRSVAWNALLHTPLLLDSMVGLSTQDFHDFSQQQDTDVSTPRGVQKDKKDYFSDFPVFRDYSPYIMHHRVLSHPAVQPAIAAMCWRQKRVFSPSQHPLSSSSPKSREDPSSSISTETCKSFVDDMNDKGSKTPRSPIAPNRSTANTVLKNDKAETCSKDHAHVARAVKLWNAAVPSPTALQWIIYTLCRLAVIGVSNNAQTILLLHSLSSVPSNVLFYNESYLYGKYKRDYPPAIAAEACMKAVKLVREHLLPAHCPLASELHSWLDFIGMHFCTRSQNAGLHSSKGSREGGTEVGEEYDTTQAPLSDGCDENLEEVSLSTNGLWKYLSVSTLLHASDDVWNSTKDVSELKANVPFSSDSSCAYKELKWCFEMHLKLLIRARQLFSIGKNPELGIRVKASLDDVYAPRWAKIRAIAEQAKATCKHSVESAELSTDDEKQCTTRLAQQGQERYHSKDHFPAADVLVMRLTQSDWEDLEKNRCAYFS